ncbi:MAG: PEP-CTERM sorting domain-containing protein [Massilia sp.]
MKPLLRALAAASVCAILSAPAQADSPVITFTMAGAIDYGRDDMNLFLAPDAGPFLGGLPFTLSLSVDSGTLATLSSSPTETHLGSESASVKGELTVNGKTFTWTTDAGSAGIGLNLGAGFPDRQEARIDTAASRADGLYVTASHEAYFFDPVVTSTDIGQPIVFPQRLSGMALTSSFQVQGTGSQAWLSTWFTANQMTSAVWTVSPVPEPRQYGMLAAGLGAIAFMRRPALRRRRPAQGC